MESIIRDHIIKHMKDNNLFSQKQFGFIDGRSTTLQLPHALHMWSDTLDQGGSLDPVYCHFMKAFNKVPHKRLAHKVEKYGITGNIIGWIKSFLSERTQRVIIKSAESNPAPVTSGIPHGSVLGPRLFVLYINDMPGVIDKDSFFYLFADDTTVFRQIQSEQDIVQLQADVNSLVNWSQTWLLRVTGSYHSVVCYVIVNIFVNMSCQQIRYNCPLTLIPCLLVDGSGWQYYIIFWPLVALTIMSRVLHFDSLHLAWNLLDRRVARIVPMTPGFQVSNYAV